MRSSRSGGGAARLVGLALAVLAAAPGFGATCPGSGFDGALCLADRALGAPFCGPRRLARGYNGRLRRTKAAIMHAEIALGSGKTARVTISLARANHQLDGIAAQAARLWTRHVIGTPCRFALDHMVDDLRDALTSIVSGTTTTTTTTSTSTTIATLPDGETTTTTIPPPECPGTLVTGAQSIDDPPYPKCVSITWSTPVPPCETNVHPNFFDADTGDQVTGGLLYPPLTHWSYSFDCQPPTCGPDIGLAGLNLVFTVCNHMPGDPGGAGTRSIRATVIWD